MRSISDTIARLSTIRPLGEIPSPEHNSLLELSDFGSNPGNLKAHYFIPATLLPDAPLVVVLHGCLQTAAAYDYGSGWSKLAEERGFALLFPEQQRSNNPNLCFNWFVPEDIQAGGGEAHSIRQMIDQMAFDHGLNRNRIFVTGLSAGGAMSGVMLAAYPDIFAGGGIIAGLPYGSANNVPAAFDRMRGHGTPTAQQLAKYVTDATSHDGPWPKISVWHGSADRTVVPSNSTAIVDQWRTVHGIGAAPASSDTVDGHTHTIWTDKRGDAVIEEYVISGLGHGTPLDVEASGYGVAGSYMIDAGISSTHRIASFWGLTDAPQQKTAKPRLHNSAERAAVDLREAKVVTKPVADTHDDWQASRFGATSPKADKIRQVIEGALRTAGLLK
jgi:poly(hydroxyalkanoate) depolymerase family esterase